MQVEVKDVLRDIVYLGEAIETVYFDGVASATMPTIDKFDTGSVKIVLRPGKSIDAMTQVLARYGIRATGNDDAYKKSVEFKCNASDDIIRMISKALRDRRTATKAYQATILQNEISTVSKQLPHVKSSMFSRGVESLRDSVETLKNTVAAQIKELSR